MIENLPVHTLNHRDLTIEGFARAAVQSYWRIPEMKLGFDLGGQPWDFMGTPNWFVSHTHLDHIAALPVYISRRRMMKMEPPTIYLPDQSLALVKQLLQTFSQLDRGRLPCQLKSVTAGQEIVLSRELVVSAHATRHTVPSLGYIVWQRRRKLKAAYRDLSGDQIRELRLSGTEVTSEQRVPRVAFLGDSSVDGLDAHPEMYDAEILISELTFLAPDHRKEKIHKMGHIHLDDFSERRDRFKNEVIIVGHFSTRYHSNQIQRYIRKAFPDLLDGRLKIWA